MDRRVSNVWRFVKRASVWLCVVLAAAYLYNGFELWKNQAKYIYHPEKAWTATPDSSGLEYEDVTFRTADGLILSGWYVPAPNPRGTILFCHGNARNISADISVLAMFRQLGFSSFAFDYRGYGKSDGAPDEKGTYLDAAAAWDHLLSERGVPKEDLLVWGRSLGSAIAADLAVAKKPAALVIEASFSSLPDIAADLYPHFPVRWLVRYKYDVAARLPRLECPVLIVHSREDELVPFRHAERLFRAAREPKELLEIAGPHRGLPYQEVYVKGIERFLDRLRGARR